MKEHRERRAITEGHKTSGALKSILISTAHHLESYILDSIRVRSVRVHGLCCHILAAPVAELSL